MDANVFAEIYGVTAQGNFEGHNILNRLGSIELRDAATERRLAGMRDEAARAPRHRACAPVSTTRCSPIGTG